MRADDEEFIASALSLDYEDVPISNSATAENSRGFSTNELAGAKKYRLPGFISFRYRLAIIIVAALAAWGLVIAVGFAVYFFIDVIF